MIWWCGIRTSTPRGTDDTGCVIGYTMSSSIFQLCYNSSLFLPPAGHPRGRLTAYSQPRRTPRRPHHLLWRQLGGRERPLARSRPPRTLRRRLPDRRHSRLARTVRHHRRRRRAGLRVVLLSGGGCEIRAKHDGGVLNLRQVGFRVCVAAKAQLLHQGALCGSQAGAFGRGAVSGDLT